MCGSVLNGLFRSGLITKMSYLRVLKGCSFYLIEKSIVNVWRIKFASTSLDNATTRVRKYVMFQCCTLSGRVGVDHDMSISILFMTLDSSICIVIIVEPSLFAYYYRFMLIVKMYWDTLTCALLFHIHDICGRSSI